MLEKFTAFIRQRVSRPLQYYQDICVRCGACVDACHFYAVTKDPVHIPAYRMMLVKKLTQSGENGDGKLLNWYREFQERDAPTAAQLEKAIWECTGCRRCAVFCPFDLDTALLVSLGRAALLQENDAHEIIAEIGQAEVSKGEIIDDIKEFYVEQVEVLEQRLQQEFAPDLRIPVEKEARVLYVPLVGEHAITPVAKIFHAAGEDWTLSQFTATNHSFFVGDMESAAKAAHWIVQEARRLGITTLVYSECGHATRTLMQYFDAWFGDELAGIERTDILSLVARYLDAGKIRVQSGAFDTPLTYHDPCNLGRNLGVFDEPRALINAVATNFCELTPNREMNWCCGGGGGLVADPDLAEIRLQAGQKKVEQIRQTQAQWVITACENCKAQLEDLDQHYELGVEVKGVVDIIADALIL